MVEWDGVCVKRGSVGVHLRVSLQRGGDGEAEEGRIVVELGGS